MRSNLLLSAAAVLLAMGGAACTATPTAPATHSRSATPPTSRRPAPRTSTWSTPPRRSTPPKPARPRTPGRARGRHHAAGPTLPGGGRHIVPADRVVAYYGAPGNAALGVLGRGTPDHAAAAVARQAAAYAPFGRRIQPAMELISTVAQGGPGPDGMYSKPIPDGEIAAYLAAAHRHRLLLILDFQPGRGDFLPQVRAVAPFLRDPSVSVALDPEWHVGPTQVPAKVIGSASAASVNAVGRYLSGLVIGHHLPDKLLVVHEFTLSMLPDRDRIIRPPGLEVVLHADGLATPAKKIHVYRQLHFPAPPFHAGFKLFYRADTGLMAPAQVMALRPQPDIVTYQ